MGNCVQYPNAWDGCGTRPRKDRLQAWPAFRTQTTTTPVNQPLPDYEQLLQEQAQLQRQHDARVRSRELFVEGKRSGEQWETLRQEFGLSTEECQKTYELMREEITWEITQAKQDPVRFVAAGYRETRNDAEASWRERISAQMELDDLFQLVERAKEPEGWEFVELQDAWAFYRAAIVAEQITRTQRLRARKRLDLLIRGPKRERNWSQTLDRQDRHRKLYADSDDGCGSPAEFRELCAQREARRKQARAGGPPPRATGVSPMETGAELQHWRNASGTREDDVTQAASATGGEDVSPPPGSAGASPSPPGADVTPPSPSAIPSSSPAPASPVRLVASESSAPTRGSRLVESESSDTPSETPPPQAQPPP